MKADWSAWQEFGLDFTYVQQSQQCIWIPRRHVLFHASRIHVVVCYRANSEPFKFNRLGVGSHQLSVAGGVDVDVDRHNMTICAHGHTPVLLSNSIMH